MTEMNSIWLEPSPGSDPDGGRMWAPNDVWGEGVEYVLASSAASAIAERDARIAELESMLTVEYTRSNQRCDNLATDYEAIIDSKNAEIAALKGSTVPSSVFRVVFANARDANRRVAELEKLLENITKVITRSIEMHKSNENRDEYSNGFTAASEAIERAIHILKEQNNANTTN